MKCEPCTYSPESVEGYLPTSSSDTGQLSLLSGINTPVESCANEPQTDGSPDCTCGKEMSDCLIHPSTPAAWIASMRDSLARTLASLENKVALAKEPDLGFTVKSCALLASFDRDTCSWKTLQQSFLTDSEPFSQTWPRWGMTAGGSAYAHPMWERRIAETGGSCWPTPNIDGFRSDGELKILSRTLSGHSEYIGMTKRACKSKREKYWPTPRANDAEKRGDFDVTNPRNGLPAAAKMFPTPTSHNHKETGAPSQQNRNTVQLGDMVGGQLNPTWVAWLMGFPIGWASLKATETPKYHCKPQPHGDYSKVSE